MFPKQFHLRKVAICHAMSQSRCAGSWNMALLQGVQTLELLRTINIPLLRSEDAAGSKKFKAPGTKFKPELWNLCEPLVSNSPTESATLHGTGKSRTRKTTRRVVAASQDSRVRT
jgi:hypothetical protein